jgi:molecular chaperone HtpG
MERMGRGEELPHGKRVLEINPEHPVVLAVQGVLEKNPADARLEGYAHLLYDQAVLAEGSRLKDPAGFARRLNELMVKDASA